MSKTEYIALDLVTWGKEDNGTINIKSEVPKKTKKQYHLPKIDCS